MINFFVTDCSNVRYSSSPQNNQYFQLIDNKQTETQNGEVDVTFDDILINVNDETLYTRGVVIGKKQDLSNLTTREEFDSLSGIVSKTIRSGTLATINNQSLEEGGNITLDMNIYVIVDELPTEGIQDNKIYLLANNSSVLFNEYDEYSHKTGSWELLGQYKADIDLSGYLKTEEADKRYLSIESAGQLNVNNNGSLQNFSSNGQAYNAIRDCSLNTITGKRYNAAAFGVKMDGTTAFSHKTYNTYNTKDGTYTGARNTAVLTFSGPSGLRYAKNTGTANDVTEDMYRYVGIIDSQDENQRVYSKAQVDKLIEDLRQEILELLGQTQN